MEENSEFFFEEAPVSDEDSVEQYLKEIKELGSSLLTAEQELALAERVARGDRLAREALIEANLRLVVSIAKRYVRPDVTLLDLVQEGNVALICAVDAFDHGRGVRFSTFAFWQIREAISSGVNCLSRGIYVPSNTVKQMRRVNKSIDDYRTLGREPLVEEIAQAAKVSRERVLELLQVQLMNPLFSLDTPENDLADTLEDTSLRPQADLQADLLGHCLAELSPQERTVIEMRFGLVEGGREHSPAEVGAAINRAERTVFHTQARALQKLRHCLTTSIRKA